MMMTPTLTRASASVQARLTRDDASAATQQPLTIWDASANTAVAFPQSQRIHSWTTVLVSVTQNTRRAHFGYVIRGSSLSARLPPTPTGILTRAL